MDALYRINVCRSQLVDSEIPLLERIIDLHLGIKGESFYGAFNDANLLSFERELCVDKVQECLFVLEEQGFKVNVEKLPSHKFNESEMDVEEKPSTGVHSLTYEDCQIMFSGKESSINRFSKHKNWIVFLCSLSVACVYLLLVYSSLL